MSIKLYLDIDINGSQFSIIEGEHKGDGALHVLRRIEEVMCRGLRYSSLADDSYSKISEDELRERLKLVAESVRNGYLNKCQSISSIRRFFGRVSHKERHIQSVYARIESLAHPLTTPLSIAIPQVETCSSGECFLTGKVEIVKLEVGSPELSKNLEAAKSIIEHVQDTIFYSSNYPQRSKVMRKFAKQAQVDTTFNTLYEDNMRQIRYRLRNQRQTTNFNDTGSLIDCVTKSRTGNCGEMARYGHQYAKKHQISIEQWMIGGGDHAFLVIGGSQSSNYKYWDCSAVICDPWSGCYYPATHLEIYLKNYITVSKKEGIYKTKIESFDRRKHTILRRS